MQRNGPWRISLALTALVQHKDTQGGTSDGSNSHAQGRGGNWVEGGGGLGARFPDPPPNTGECAS